MAELIYKGALYNKVAELEETARNRVLDTPTNSPCYIRYASQMNERTALKHLIADTETTTESEIRAKAISDFMKEAMEQLSDLALERDPTVVDDCKIILNGIAEQLKGE